MAEKKYAVDYFVDSVLAKWKKDGTVKGKEKEEDTKWLIHSFVHVLSSYRFQCLLKTLLEIDDLMGEFDWDKYND